MFTKLGPLSAKFGPRQPMVEFSGIPDFLRARALDARGAERSQGCGASGRSGDGRFRSRPCSGGASPPDTRDPPSTFPPPARQVPHGRVPRHGSEACSATLQAPSRRAGPAEPDDRGRAQRLPFLRERLAHLKVIPDDEGLGLSPTKLAPRNGSAQRSGGHACYRQNELLPIVDIPTFAMAEGGATLPIWRR